MGREAKKDMDGCTKASRNSPTVVPARPRSACRWPSHNASLTVKWWDIMRDRVVPISGLARTNGCCVRSYGVRVCVRLGEAWRDVARDGHRGVSTNPSPTGERLHWDSLRLSLPDS